MKNIRTGVCVVFFYSNMIHDKHNLQHIIVKDCFKLMYFKRYFPITVGSCLGPFVPESLPHSTSYVYMYNFK